MPYNQDVKLLKLKQYKLFDQTSRFHEWTDPALLQKESTNKELLMEKRILFA